MMELYLKKCDFYISLNKKDMEEGKCKHFKTAEIDYALLDMDDYYTKTHLDGGTFSGEEFDSLWKFFKKIKHTEFEENMLCFGYLEENAIKDGKRIGRRIILLNHYNKITGSSKKYKCIFDEIRNPDICWKFEVTYSPTKMLNVKQMRNRFPEKAVNEYIKQHNELKKNKPKKLGIIVYGRKKDINETKKI